LCETLGHVRGIGRQKRFNKEVNHCSSLLAPLCAFVILIGLGGCASVPPNAGKNPVDPFERVNRQVFAFNDHFDRAIMTPAAKGYTAVVPKPVRVCVGNIFDNLFEVTSIVNLTLQGRPKDVGMDFGRFVVNSTVGVFGCFDLATHVGLERNKQYFALTMGKWGIAPGPYLVLPILGPRTVRDALGEIPDYFTDPISYITPVKDAYFAQAGRLVVKRAKVMDALALAEQAALDPYEFQRDAYLQMIRSLIYDGNPPPIPEDEDPDNPAADVLGGSPSRKGAAAPSPPSIP
jgi:phospholipid-binding lipoprotein MlaA